MHDLFVTGRGAGIRPDRRRRCLVRLDALNAASQLRHLDVPGFRLHPLKGDRAGRWAIDINGPWRITFEWSGDGHVDGVDLEQYH